MTLLMVEWGSQSAQRKWWGWGAENNRVWDQEKENKMREQSVRMKSDQRNSRFRQ